MLLDRLPFTSLPMLFSPMAEKKRRRDNLGLPSRSPVLLHKEVGEENHECSK